MADAVTLVSLENSSATIAKGGLNGISIVESDRVLCVLFRYSYGSDLLLLLVTSTQTGLLELGSKRLTSADILTGGNS